MSFAPGGVSAFGSSQNFNNSLASSQGSSNNAYMASSLIN
jgi:hypothetical protein